MAVEDVSNLSAVLDLRWVEDGISEWEYQALDTLGHLDTPVLDKPPRGSRHFLGAGWHVRGRAGHYS